MGIIDTDDTSFVKAANSDESLLPESFVLSTVLEEFTSKEYTMIFDKAYAHRMLDTYIKDVYKIQPESLVRNDSNLSSVKDDVVSKLWDTCLRAADGYSEPINGLTAELLIEALQGQSIDIMVNRKGENTTIISMPNNEYWITDGNGYIESYPLKKSGFFQHMFMRWITMKSESFADFLVEFDSFLPQVDVELKKVEMDLKKQVLLLNIVRDTIRELEGTLLVPFGVRFQSVSRIDQDGFTPVCFAKDGLAHSYKVKLDINRIKESLIKVPTLLSEISPFDEVTLTV